LKPTPLLLTLAGTGSFLGAARWSADGNVILAGSPWQAWRAPSWQEIAATPRMPTLAAHCEVLPSIFSESSSGLILFASE